MTAIWTPTAGNDREDHFGHSTFAQVQKFDEDQVNWVVSKTGILNPSGQDLLAHVQPYEVVCDNTPNLTVTTGLGRLTSLLCGLGGAVFSTTTAAIGIGTSSTTETAADVGLTLQNWWQVVSSVAPGTVTVTNDSLVAAATFDSTHANVVWAEWGLGVVTSGSAASAATLAGIGTTPILFNHKVAALGTKASGSSWVFTVKLTWS
jgi:hypothetical protein